MSYGLSGGSIKLHIRSLFEHMDNAFLLTVIAYYHLKDIKLDLHHTINFGKVWMDIGNCDHGFISLPYNDGPLLEYPKVNEIESVRFLWLLPITQSELNYKIKFGVEMLERKFEEKSLVFRYSDHKRNSII